MKNKTSIPIILRDNTSKGDIADNDRNSNKEQIEERDQKPQLSCFLN